MTLVRLEPPPAARSPVPAPSEPGKPLPLPVVTGTTVRVRAAMIRDVDRIGPLIDGFARRGLMLPKTREQLYRTFREFMVAEDEAGRLLGCVALRVYTAEVAEVSALAVAQAAHGRGVGRRLVHHLTAEAAALGLNTLFALTLEEGFFRRLGYRTVDRAEFPLKVAGDCAICPRRDACLEVTVARRIGAEYYPSGEDGTQ